METYKWSVCMAVKAVVHQCAVQCLLRPQSILVELIHLLCIAMNVPECWGHGRETLLAIISTLHHSI